MNVLNKHDFPTMEHGRQLLKDKDGYIEKSIEKEIRWHPKSYKIDYNYMTMKLIPSKKKGSPVTQRSGDIDGFNDEEEKV